MSKTYGEPDPAFTLTGLPATWAPGVDYEAEFTRAPGEDVGEHVVDATVTILADGHVSGPVAPGALTITARPLVAAMRAGPGMDAEQ
ncbi:MAG: hypothetical protein LBS56_01005 [Propionibacteriaceae bacterium]|nr:hypothetical protein [Propionibacteriaceae bacterium]